MLRTQQRRASIGHLRRHWPLLARLLAELRTLRNVRLAVLFGSTARGTGDEHSDLDLLVRFRRPGLAGRARLLERLGAASERPLQVVELADASPLLLADVLRDGRVLKLLEQVSEDDYRHGVRSRDPEVLTRQVYPLERAFEVASNYTRELAALALAELDLESADTPSDFRLLRDEGVVTGALCEALIQIQSARNALHHDYPDLRAASIHRAASLQLTELPRFLRSYAQWLRDRGYGRLDA